MEIGIVDTEIFAAESGVVTSKICNQYYLEWLLGKYLDEIQALDKRLADPVLWRLTPEKQKSRQKRLDHLRNRCLPFVSDKIEALRTKARDEFRDLFEPL